MPKKGFNLIWCKVSSTRAFELEFPTINKCSEVTSILDFYCDRGRYHNRVKITIRVSPDKRKNPIPFFLILLALQRA